MCLSYTYNQHSLRPYRLITLSPSSCYPKRDNCNKPRPLIPGLKILRHAFWTEFLHFWTSFEKRLLYTVMYKGHSKCDAITIHVRIRLTDADQQSLKECDSGTSTSNLRLGLKSFIKKSGLNTFMESSTGCPKKVVSRLCTIMKELQSRLCRFCTIA